MLLELLELHAGTLFRHDELGRIVETNQDQGPPAPRLYLGRTLEGNVYRLRHDLPASLVSELEALLAHEPVTDDLNRPVATFQDLHDALEAHAPVEQVWQGPAWRFPERIRQADDVVTMSVEDAVVARRWFPWLADEIAAGVTDSLPCAAVMHGDDAVSICFCSRTSAQASEAGVETVEAFRGRGFATAAVARWAQEVRLLGREPLYSTSWDNRASRAVARRLGLILYGVDLHIT